MKMLQRQPICITRLKKKQSSNNIISLCDTSNYKDSRAQLNELNQNTNNQHIIIKDPLLKETSRQYYTTTESYCYLQKENSGLGENYQSIAHDEELLKRIKELENANQQLHHRNRQLTVQLGIQQNQKRILYARIQKLEKDMSKLESQFQQQYQSHSNRTQNLKMSTPELMLTTPKPKQSSIHVQRSSFSGYRRMSFHEPFESYCQDYSAKAKQYKNQLEIEKVRRLNLQRQLNNVKENIKLEFKNQLLSMEHKLENLKEIIMRKDREINQKQDLIQRYIVRK